MDEDAKEEIVEEINPQRGIESELDRVLSKNDSLQKSDSWDSPTRQQKAEIRDRITADDSREGLKYRKNDKTYIRVDKDNYRRVAREEDVYVDKKTDTVWLRDSSGKFKKVVK